jgi:hypothetical protein
MQVDDKQVETTYKFLTSHVKSALLLIIILMLSIATVMWWVGH